MCIRDRPTTSGWFHCCPEGYYYSGDGLCCSFEESPCRTPVPANAECPCCPEGYVYQPITGGCCPREGFVLDSSCAGAEKVIPCPSVITESSSPPTKVIIGVGDPDYFYNKSWTMSFSFLSNSWASWHSYMPSFYVPAIDFFQAGNNKSSTCTVWDHNNTYDLFNSFFGISYPYIIEYPFSYGYQDELVQNIEEYTTILKYTDFNNYYETEDIYAFFNQAIVYNNQASTGLMYLIEGNTFSLNVKIGFPHLLSTSIDILTAKTDHIFSYNMIWNNLINSETNQWLDSLNPEYGNKTLNGVAFDYINTSFKKYPLRAKDTLVRHIKSDSTPYKMISKFVIVKTQNMYS